MMTAVLHPTIALLQTSSLASVVQQEVERAILQGHYAPGSKLTEAALAQKMGVSRGPVREAFRMLEEAGLVRTEKNRGVYVRDIPMDEAVEIFDLRAAMDELVGRRLAENITQPQLKEIRALVDAMEKAVKSRNHTPTFPPRTDPRPPPGLNVNPAGGTRSRAGAGRSAREHSPRSSRIGASPRRGRRWQRRRTPQ